MKINRRSFCKTILIGGALAGTLSFSGCNAGKPQEISKPDAEIECLNKKTIEWLVNEGENLITGKKRFVEALEAYCCICNKTLDEENKSACRERLEILSKIPEQENYHNLGNKDFIKFREENLSYLRAEYLLDKAGFKTNNYQKEIKKIAPELQLDFIHRGIHQKIMFAFYFDRLGIKHRNNTEEIFRQSKIRAKRNIEDITKQELYQITHEVFGLQDNNRLDILTKEDISYLNDAFPIQIHKNIAEADIDILAEIVMSMNYLGMKGKDYFRARDFIMKSQNKNGSFGDSYPLHTTSVSIRAFNEDRKTINL